MEPTQNCSNLFLAKMDSLAKEGSSKLSLELHGLEVVDDGQNTKASGGKKNTKSPKTALTLEELRQLHPRGGFRGRPTFRGRGFFRSSRGHFRGNSPRRRRSSSSPRRRRSPSSPRRRRSPSSPRRRRSPSSPRRHRSRSSSRRRESERRRRRSRSSRKRHRSSSSSTVSSERSRRKDNRSSERMRLNAIVTKETNECHELFLKEMRETISVLDSYSNTVPPPPKITAADIAPVSLVKPQPIIPSSPAIAPIIAKPPPIQAAPPRPPRIQPIAFSLLKAPAPVPQIKPASDIFHEGSSSPEIKKPETAKKTPKAMHIHELMNYLDETRYKPPSKVKEEKWVVVEHPKKKEEEKVIYKDPNLEKSMKILNIMKKTDVPQIVLKANLKPVKKPPGKSPLMHSSNHSFKFTSHEDNTLFTALNSLLKLGGLPALHVLPKPEKKAPIVKCTECAQRKLIKSCSIGIQVREDELEPVDNPISLDVATLQAFLRNRKLTGDSSWEQSAYTQSNIHSNFSYEQSGDELYNPY